MAHLFIYSFIHLSYVISSQNLPIDYTSYL